MDIFEALNSNALGIFFLGTLGMHDIFYSCSVLFFGSLDVQEFFFLAVVVFGAKIVFFKITHTSHPKLKWSTAIEAILR